MNIKVSWPYFMQSFCKLFLHPFFLVLVITHLSFGQNKLVKSNAPPQKADSCHLTVYRVVTKEMSKSYDDIREDRLKQISLSYPDMTSLEKKLSKKPSYAKDRALLTHHNLVFDFFKDGEISAKVYISTLTGNVSINNLSNRSKFNKRVSTSFGAYLLWLLDRNKVIGLIPESDLEGLTSSKEG